MLKPATLLFIFFLLVTLNLFSQKVVDKEEFFNRLLKDIDRIEVVCFQNNDSTKYIITKQNEIKTFTEIITGRENLTKIKANNKRGYLVYYHRRYLKLKVDLLETGLIYNYKKETIISLLTYQADMLFLETCNPTRFNIKE